MRRLGFPALSAILVIVGALLSACHSPTTPTTTSSIAVTGTVPAVGQTSQLLAKATLSNGTSQDVTTQATWSSSNTAIATVSTGGLLKVLQLGGAQITATYQGASGQFPVSLSVTSVTVMGPMTTVVGTGRSASLQAGGSVPLIAIANLSNGLGQEVSHQATWSSSNPVVALVSIPVNTPIEAFGGGFGSVDISATYQGVTGRISLSVIPSPCQFVVGAPGIVTGNPPGTFGIPAFAAIGGSQTLTVTMTQGGSECTWQFGTESGGGPGPNGHPVLNSVSTVVRSQAGTTAGGNAAQGSGNGTITITVDAGGGLFRNSAALISMSPSADQGAFIAGVTVWNGILYQSP